MCFLFFLRCISRSNRPETGYTTQNESVCWMKASTQNPIADVWHPYPKFLSLYEQLRVKERESLPLEDPATGLPLSALIRNSMENGYKLACVAYSPLALLENLLCIIT